MKRDGATRGWGQGTEKEGEERKKEKGGGGRDRGTRREEVPRWVVRGEGKGRWSVERVDVGEREREEYVW